MSLVHDDDELGATHSQAAVSDMAQFIRFIDARMGILRSDV